MAIKANMTVDPYSRVDCRLALNRAIPVPLWSQIETWLADVITTGKLAPGQLLGSEHDLADRFGVSRATVRQALHGLAERGLITRSRGNGTRVGHRAPAPDRSITNLSSSQSTTCVERINKCQSW